MATEKRLIDANALESYLWVLFNFFGSLPCSEADKATQRGIKRCIGEVKKMPTVDAVEVVRCKDCKWYTLKKNVAYNGHFCDKIIEFVKPDDFCSFAERRTND